MKSSNLKTCWYVSALLLLVGSTAHATTLYVNCGGRSASGTFTSIGAALKALKGTESRGPSTINVSGACVENIQITNLDGLTLNSNSASITDASNGALETIGIYRANNITINGLSVSGGEAGVNINMASVALNGVTAQRAAAEGVAVYAGGKVYITGGTYQDNGYAGLGVYGADAMVAGATMQRNGSGVVVDRAGRVVYRPSSVFTDSVSAPAPAILSYNKAAGATIQRNSQFQCVSCQITNNAGDGVSVDLGATVNLARFAYTSGYANQLEGTPDPVVITDNGGSGVSVGDLSNVTFPNLSANAIIQRNGGQYQIACNTVTSVTRKALLFATGGPNGATNCTN